MGKPKARKSSMKTIQEIISSFNPVAPICIQQSRTHSFRESDLYPDTSCSSVYYTPPSPSLSSHSTTSASVSFSSCRQRPPLARNADDDDVHGQPTGIPSDDNFAGAPALPPAEGIRSSRFFFSPKTTKSIMEEGKAQLRGRQIKSRGELRQGRDFAGAGADRLCFCEENVRLVMSSENPYRDFKTSMEEMVDAHGLRDWSELQKLLQCYLSLNDKKTHNIIMLAFVDILMRSLASPSRENPGDDGSISSLPCPSPLAQLCYN